MLLDGIDRAVGTRGVQSGWWGESNVTRVRIHSVILGGIVRAPWSVCGSSSCPCGTTATAFSRIHGRSSMGINAVHFEGGRWRNNWRNSFYIKNVGVHPGATVAHHHLYRHGVRGLARDHEARMWQCASRRRDDRF